MIQNGRVLGLDHLAQFHRQLFLSLRQTGIQFCQFRLDHCHVLQNIVVQVARQAAPLFFIVLHQALGQPAQRGDRGKIGSRQANQLADGVDILHVLLGIIVPGQAVAQGQDAVQRAAVKDRRKDARPVVGCPATGRFRVGHGPDAEGAHRKGAVEQEPADAVIANVAGLVRPKFEPPVPGQQQFAFLNVHLLHEFDQHPVQVAPFADVGQMLGQVRGHTVKVIRSAVQHTVHPDLDIWAQACHQHGGKHTAQQQGLLRAAQPGQQPDRGRHSQQRQRDDDEPGQGAVDQQVNF